MDPCQPSTTPSRPPAPPLRPSHTSADPVEVYARLDSITNAVEKHAETICKQLEHRGFFVIDEFLGDDTCAAMRAEAENFHRLGYMAPSQSTRWDPSKKELVPYDKHNVLSMQVQGGVDQYGLSPRLVEYTVGLTESLAPVVAAHFPDSAPLDGTAQSNKLAVCLGDGSAYDKHIDNQGGGDLRKLTVLYYLNRRDWDVDACGGSFRAFSDFNMFSPPQQELGEDTQQQRSTLSPENDGDASFEYTDIDCTGDRLFGFWSDKLVHRVMPSFAPSGYDDYRYALTVWMLVRDVAFISHDADVERRHFGHLDESVDEKATAGQG
eukprot:CAMPEP_0171697384 /NCGR_PEP_ID=MMETSP0991-20121206/8789_1 /TAXON_ID=483369 /ORGANISM="non described non described, Strain CCMP2098" /LENGTH=321 /DNA_ID=CAMNT_0012286167 /DNA_START=62 /DNA_END=1028 /DNA_ORIENTATION=+